jgi:hypothetical protein
MCTMIPKLTTSNDPKHRRIKGKSSTDAGRWIGSLRIKHSSLSGFVFVLWAMEWIDSAASQKVWSGHQLISRQAMNSAITDSHIYKQQSCIGYMPYIYLTIQEVHKCGYDVAWTYIRKNVDLRYVHTLYFGF